MYVFGRVKSDGALVSIDDFEFAIMAVRLEHKTALVSARDRVEQLLRAMGFGGRAAGGNQLPRCGALPLVVGERC
jgi:hypothetical protein